MRRTPKLSDRGAVLLFAVIFAGATTAAAAPPDSVVGQTFWTSDVRTEDGPVYIAAEPTTDALAPEVDFEGKKGTGEKLLDNLSLYACLDASREPQDLGINANFGAYFAANFGAPLLPQYGLGFQIGTGANIAHAGVKVLRLVEGTRDREQWFNTFGLFQRLESGWSSGLVYDLQTTTYYSQIFAGQFRGQIGKQVGENNEFGFWGTARSFGDHATITDVNIELRPITQGSLFWRHRWQTGAETKIWLGLSERHGKDVLLLPDPGMTKVTPTFGLAVFVPLNDHFALFGEGNFITPSDTGTLDAYLGFAFYPSGGARRSRTNRFAPVLATANNPTFSLDLRRR